MISVCFLLNSQRIKNCKSTESFCLSILTIYIKYWSTFWHVYCYRFCYQKFLNMCKSRTTFYLLWRAVPPGLALYRSELPCLLSWLGMVNADWLGSIHAIGNFFANEIYHFLGLSNQTGCFFSSAACSI